LGNATIEIERRGYRTMSPEKDGRDVSGGRDPESKSGPASDDVGRLLNPSAYQSSSSAEIKETLNQAAAGDLTIKLEENVLLGLFTDGERREFVAAMDETGLSWEELSSNGDAVKEASSPAPALLYNILCERFSGRMSVRHVFVDANVPEVAFLPT